MFLNGITAIVTPMEHTCLAIDIGTSSLKAALLTHHGEVLASVRRRIMQPSEETHAFQNSRWITALREAIPPVVGRNKPTSIAISGNGPTVVAVDAAGAVVGEPLLWLDRRAIPVPESASFYLPKIKWFHEESGLGATVRWYLPFPEFLVYLLTGEAVAITPSDEFSRFIWSEPDILRACIPGELLPPFVTVGSIVGTVQKSIGTELGIPVGIPVVAAGSDFHMSLVGTDALQPGRTCDRAGTSEGINFCADREIQDPALRTLPHVVPGLYNVAGILSSTGLLFEWFREISGQRGTDYGTMMMDILQVPDSRDEPWFFPTAHRGESWEFRRGMFIGLGAEHTRADMGRAVVLSIGFAVREAVETLRAAGCPVTDLRACGGQARNGLWMQMKADITELPITTPVVADAELVGNLCCSLMALGEASNLADAAPQVVHELNRWEPNPQRQEWYRQRYEEYQERFHRFRSALDAC